ncbi:Cation/H(+) antiporter 4 [Sesamum alatum]|uniref:Cation/H(+) antiporter 4 n=1 Tax=Sesamum alatum TaxID=300844 RepID=A0AAE2CSZ3_9LAMI|nr:Cation/H(+) antiporter 4 [Sesamum alatum]
MDGGTGSADFSRLHRPELPGNVTDDYCYVDIALHSPGIWETNGNRSFLHFVLPRLQLQLAIIFILTQSLHLLLRRFHLPRLVSEILAGIILGPTILGQLPQVQAALFPREGDVYLDLLSKIGYIFFIFLCGVKMDPRTVLRTGIKAWTIGVLAVTIPYGPFLFGLLVPDGPPLGSTLVDRLETLVSGLLAPLLVTYCGMNVNLVELYDLRFIGTVWMVIGMCLLVKLVAIFVPAIICRVPLKDAAALAFTMSAQGVVQMSFYYYNAVNQTFDGETFSMLTISVLIQAAAANVIVKALYDYSRMYTGYQKRDIQHTAFHSELRVLSCGHRVDDVLAVRKILEASFPSRESPLAVYALHLVELAGRAHPQLIDHQLGQKSSGGTRTQKMIEVLYSFEQQFAGVVTVQQFTAMSLTKFMHHDICTVAFNKLASLIILPFHRKWNHQGKMILDSGSLRAINSDVLDMAPCSVSILIDRHKVRRNPSSTYNVGVTFFGGMDDREALAYARRMAQSPDVHLTVVRFVPWDIYAGDSQWDAVLDAEILKETRMQGTHQDNIVYKEERVKDGAETALLIHAMEEAFDLIMVGRRHKDDTPQLLGLSEWNDLPELGPVGDMLAAPDLSTPISVLVVQHQNVKGI